MAEAVIYFVSLGCAKNLVDSENLMGRLEGAGYHFTSDAAAADVIIVNTCGFIESAAAESIDTILALAHHKTASRCQRLLVVGCLPQRHREDLVQALPEVDFFLGTDALAHIERVLKQPFAERSRLAAPEAFQELPEMQTRRLSTFPTAYLKVSEGCSRQCTYCIIPRLRGRQRSRQPMAILTEARNLMAQGIGELVLIGQDTTAYGADLDCGTSLAQLLDELAILAAVQAPRCWIRFLYGHPLSLSADLLDVLGRHANICPYLDIPIQHASDRVLKRMGRQYTQDDLRRLFGDVRAQLPEAALRTTVIVGFPGETPREFDTLLDFVEEMQFDHLGAFAYSDAPDLASHHLPRHVSAKVAQKRLNILMEMQMEIAAGRNQRHIGRLMPVLVEGAAEEGPGQQGWREEERVRRKEKKRFNPSPHSSRLTPHLNQGRSMLQAPDVDGIIHLEGPLRPVGSLVQVKITHAEPYDLTGVIIE